MSAVSGRSRPRSLRKKRSVVSSDLPKLYRQFSKNGIDHHEAIEVNMSSTNELILNAFRDLNLGTNQEGSVSTHNHSVRHDDFTAKEGTTADAPVPSSSLFTGSFEQHCILTEGSTSKEQSTLTCEAECSILHEESCSLDCSGEQTLLKTPPSATELSLSRSKVTNTSSSSIDSGVYSPRGSKRPSVEPLSPVDHQSNQIICPQQRSRTLSGGSGCRSGKKPSKGGNTDVSVDDTTKRPPRLSVDQDAFSELLRAATKLVLDAQPMSDLAKAGLQGNSLYLRNSLQYFKRRKSEWDISGLKPQPSKVVRKKSAEPVLQRLSSKPPETKSKRVSACIICERNKRVNESMTSSILIKTTMVRTMQERRRFSEVLKVYKPGELPFTEFVVPKICELRTPAEPPEDAAAKLKDLIDDNMPTFVRLTNWNCLYAHLVSKRLLDAHMREFMLSSSSSNQQKGNKFYGEYMPTHGTCGYQRLLQCYREEPEHCGHETLATLLENGLLT